jgi:hypothetical protein
MADVSSAANTAQPKKKRSAALLEALGKMSDPAPHDEIAGIPQRTGSSGEAASAPEALPAEEEVSETPITATAPSQVPATVIVVDTQPDAVPMAEASVPPRMSEASVVAQTTVGVPALTTPVSRLPIAESSSPALYASEKRVEKMTLTLLREDLALLDEFHAEARRHGVKMRRGGNPSLFARASLRLLYELMLEDPSSFVRRVEAVAEVLGRPQQSA